MAGAKTNERPGTRAQVKYVRSSAYKAREVLNLVRGKSYSEASEILTFLERRISDTVLKCLDSAVANAENNDHVSAEELYVSACYADEGPTLKRWRPRARGRATRIRKRTCHITIIMGRYSALQLEELKAREEVRGTSSRSNAADARRQRVAKSREREEALLAAQDDTDHDHESTETDTGQAISVDTSNETDLHVDKEDLEVNEETSKEVGEESAEGSLSDAVDPGSHSEVGKEASENEEDSE